MHRTRVRRRRAVVTVAVAAGLAVTLSALGRVPARGAIPVADRRYVVRPGDTLWSVARSLGGGDPRPVVDAIQRANRLDPGALVPGRTITIPAS